MIFVHHCKRGSDRIETGLVHVVFPFNAKKGKQRVANIGTMTRSVARLVMVLHITSILLKCFPVSQTTDSISCHGRIIIFMSQFAIFH